MYLKQDLCCSQLYMTLTVRICCATRLTNCTVPIVLTYQLYATSRTRGVTPTMEIFPVEILSVKPIYIHPHFLLLRLAQTFGLRSPIYNIMLSHLAFVELCLREAYILAFCSSTIQTYFNFQLQKRVFFHPPLGVVTLLLLFFFFFFFLYASCVCRVHHVYLITISGHTIYSKYIIICIKQNPKCSRAQTLPLLPLGLFEQRGVGRVDESMNGSPALYLLSWWNKYPVRPFSF